MPLSCCNPNATAEICDNIRLNVTDNSNGYIASSVSIVHLSLVLDYRSMTQKQCTLYYCYVSLQGCIPVLVNGVNTYLGAIAGVGIVFGLFQVIIIMQSLTN